MSGRTVIPFPGAVNSIRTDMGTAPVTPGRRLERYVRQRWLAVDGKRGMLGLCDAAGITRETLYTWFRGEVEPSLGSIAVLAETLKVQRADVVAAMDGYDLAAVQRDVIAREVEAAVAPLRALMRDAGLLPEATVPDAVPLGGRAPKARVA